ncbi:aromatic-L-amino-acid decarboxylase-like [Cimex lectularius]|uniref:Aromatic-L-amino-acid decarboxylase n=1 Tax=Cimex lectularius TaxID=79782 RepID=A0A8I6SK09_CIMLE|nr:aromatic-L-amino-acid decarboxylase-like [Cimex lectularius]XP_024082770.1 aromatic-L-amino-acid decarboxylase-like [Cimex lectularius]
MDSKEFREFGKATVDFIADYIENIRERSALPNVEKGYLHKLLPGEVPKDGQNWKDVLADVENTILPGLTHWQSPKFNAYFPTASSYPSIVGEMLSAAFGCMGFSWIASPACTELEVLTLNWLGQLIGLPSEFLSSSGGPGGGVIQGSASEATLVAILVSKEKVLKEIKAQNPDIDEDVLQGKLVAYSSDESNSSVEKAGKLASVKLRLLKTDREGRLRGSVLLEAIKKDKSAGLIPFCVITTLGTTGTCAIDPLNEIGPICHKENIWLHIDAAYAGAAAICPEYRYIMDGVRYGDSFDINAHKWLLVNFDCSVMWLKNTKYLIEAFNVDRLYLKHESHQENKNAPDFRHWQIPLGRRFRSLKLWMTLRIYGVNGLQKHIRNHCQLAKYFETLVKNDHRFELVIPATFGLVGFRIKGDNGLSQKLLEKLTSSKQLYLVATNVNDKFVLRYVICSRLMDQNDVNFAWEQITGKTSELIHERYTMNSKQMSVCPKKEFACENNNVRIVN